MPYPDPGQPHGLRTRLIVGLEVHVELMTRSKMWTSAPNTAHPDYFDAAPNTLLDPVVVGMPGTLPSMNREALDMSIRVGLALGCTIAQRTKWDRKSYYYPDLPKNYQISQYDQPLCEHGQLTLLPSGQADLSPPASPPTIRILRAHLEEDAGKLLHELPGGGYSDGSLVDLNRAGTPLLEVVTQPDLHSAEDAVAFCQQLRDLCRHLGVTAGILQRGHMRFEPNINVHITTPGNEVFKTPIVEVKNLNSFKAVHGSIIHEHHRQVEQWLKDRKVMSPGSKQTRGWDDNAGVTTPQREKEDAHDYRYFPDPDLIEVAIDAGWLDRLKQSQPESPQAKRVRWVNTLKLKPADADQLLTEPGNTAFFEQCLHDCNDDTVAPRLAALLLNTGMKRANESTGLLGTLGITSTQVAELLSLMQANKVSSTAADKLFNLLCTHADAERSEASGPTVQQLAQQHALLQVNDSAALDAWVKQVLDDPKNAKAVADLRAGTDKAIGAIIGQVMKLSKGSANPQLVTEAVRRLL